MAVFLFMSAISAAIGEAFVCEYMRGFWLLLYAVGLALTGGVFFFKKK